MGTGHSPDKVPIIEEEFQMSKVTMVNVRGDLWYSVKDYMTDAQGAITSVLADNGTWYEVAEVKSIV